MIITKLKKQQTKNPKLFLNKSLKNTPSGFYEVDNWDPFSVQLLIGEISSLKEWQHRSSSISKGCPCVQLLYSLSWMHCIFSLPSVWQATSLPKARGSELHGSRNKVLSTSSSSLDSLLLVQAQHQLPSQLWAHLLPAKGLKFLLRRC